MAAGPHILKSLSIFKIPPVQPCSFGPTWTSCKLAPHPRQVPGLTLTPAPEPSWTHHPLCGPARGPALHLPPLHPDQPASPQLGPACPLPSETPVTFSYGISPRKTAICVVPNSGLVVQPVKSREGCMDFLLKPSRAPSSRLPGRQRAGLQPPGVHPVGNANSRSLQAEDLGWGCGPALLHIHTASLIPLVLETRKAFLNQAKSTLRGTRLLKAPQDKAPHSPPGPLSFSSHGCSRAERHRSGPRPSRPSTSSLVALD